MELIPGGIHLDLVAVTDSVDSLADYKPTTTPLKRPSSVSGSKSGAWYCMASFTLALSQLFTAPASRLSLGISSSLRTWAWPLLYYFSASNTNERVSTSTNLSRRRRAGIKACRVPWSQSPSKNAWKNSCNDLFFSWECYMYSRLIWQFLNHMCLTSTLSSDSLTLLPLTHCSSYFWFPSSWAGSMSTMWMILTFFCFHLDVLTTVTQYFNILVDILDSRCYFCP